MYGAAILIYHFSTPRWWQKLQSLNYSENLIKKDWIQYSSTKSA